MVIDIMNNLLLCVTRSPSVGPIAPLCGLQIQCLFVTTSQVKSFSRRVCLTIINIGIRICTIFERHLTKSNYDLTSHEDGNEIRDNSKILL